MSSSSSPIHGRVAVVVLNWNRRVDTLACLESLRHIEYRPEAVEIILIDNASSDGSAGAVREAFPQVTLIENATNLGFVGGNNQGLTYAREHGFGYCLLLNNDTEVAPDFLKLLVEGLESEPQAGIAGPMIYYYKSEMDTQPEVIWSAGGGIDLDHGRTWMIGIDETDQGQFGDRTRSVDFVTGCAFLIRLETVDRIGPLDERFFAYYEETEWCVRARRAGYTCVLVPQSKVWHKISPTSQNDSPFVHYYMTRNRLLFLKLAHASFGAWYHTLINDYARTLLSWSLKPRWRNKRMVRNMMLKGISDYFTANLGKVV